MFEPSISMAKGLSVNDGAHRAVELKRPGKLPPKRGGRSLLRCRLMNDRTSGPNPESWPSQLRTPPRSARRVFQRGKLASCASNSRSSRLLDRSRPRGPRGQPVELAARLLAMWPPTTAAVPTTAVVRTAALANGSPSHHHVKISPRSEPQTVCWKFRQSRGAINRAGIRAPSSRTPLHFAAQPQRTASPRRPPRSSNAADESGSSAAAAYSMSAGLISPPTSPANRSNPAACVELVDLKGK